MLNQQPPEKRASSDGSVLAVNSIFHTIQGEGPFAGCPSVFVRLAGCNLQCPLCDTEYSMRSNRTIDQIIYAVRTATLPPAPAAGRPAPCDLVVITGGEPFRQTIGPLVRELVRQGFLVQIETNGTFFESEFPYLHPNVTVVMSPKAGAVHSKLWDRVRHVKYVATAESIAEDGLPRHALEHPNVGGLPRPPKDWEGTIYLQPVDEKDIFKDADNMKAVVKSCMQHGYRLCLQMHKIVGVD